MSGRLRDAVIALATCHNVRVLPISASLSVLTSWLSSRT